jgi:RNA polymerase-binding protein DksA
MAPKGKKKTTTPTKAKTKPKRAQVRSSRPALSNERLEHYKQLLLAKRRELLQNVNHMEEEALRKSMQSSGDLSSMPIHMADLGSDNYEQDLAVGLMDGERRLLTEIDRALDRVADGTYGICEGTEKPIPKARLEAMPWAKYCIEYERMIEDGRAEP